MMHTRKFRFYSRFISFHLSQCKLRDSQKLQWRSLFPNAKTVFAYLFSPLPRIPIDFSSTSCMTVLESFEVRSRNRVLSAALI